MIRIGFSKLAVVKSLSVKKFICLLVVTLILSSCEKKQISILPFEVTKDVSCGDLYDNGYKRSFGVDVILIGKKMNDTTIFYQIDIPTIAPEERTFYNFYKSRPTVVNPINKSTKYDKYLEMDALTLKDSIYEFVWGDIQKQQRDICSEGKVSWRNFMLELKKEETENYRNTIDTNKYKILNINKDSDYYIDKFKVVNLITKDTFYCSVYEQNKKYYFSSTFTLINYE
ncbi:hypothetical protein LPB136_05455 [Tenacibaculum todarodis]|uniref:Lipoprotein n=1 Tax=Tenacibaculum todarodis TaxID=1850252 RepID=A0A1L3JI88_9FLAO|nr:hypothetical protein [Tenacibaculum todarodis]APG64838.1 hypothetical protein LPB136_05455 [Tenacibaculum todarodis]